jgi:hypothetical protein
VRQRVPDGKALRWWNLSLTRVLPALLGVGAAAACGGLDPIVGPLDGTAGDVAQSDAGAPSDAAAEASDDASDADVDGAVTTLFPCGTKLCDAKTHYCERKGVGDAGSKDAGTEVDTCIALPLNCVDGGGVPSCGCILEPCTCEETGTAITVTCP